MPKNQRYSRNVPKRTVSDQLLRDIGQRLQWLREAFGHTQAQWARALQITPQQLNKWEAGTRMPNLDALVDIVRSFRASFDYLFQGHLSQEMAPELRARLFELHGSQLTLSVPPPSVPRSGPPTPPRPRQRKRDGRQGVGT